MRYRNSADNVVSASVPTRVYIYPGLPHGFRRWATLPAADTFDSDIIAGIDSLINSLGESREWEAPWMIY